MRFLPVFLDTAAGVVIVVGAGEPALGKLRLLRAAGAHVRWFPGGADVAEEMLALSAPSPLEISLAAPLEADWSDAVAIVSAAGDPLDTQIAAAYRLALNRSPTREEAKELAAYAGKHGLTNLCRLILNSNEFMFVN